jgi:hypothetical protein
MGPVSVKEEKTVYSSFLLSQQRSDVVIRSLVQSAVRRQHPFRRFTIDELADAIHHSSPQHLLETFCRLGIWAGPDGRYSWDWSAPIRSF